MLNTLKASLSRLATLRSRTQAWQEDPLLHPDIQAMDLNQIADLPLWAGRHGESETDHRPDEQDLDDFCETEGVAGRRIGRFSLAVPLAVSLLAGLAAGSSDALAQSSDTMAAFSMPANVDQWRADIFGQNGAYRFRQVGGNCQITFGQNRGADAARANGQDPRHGINAYIDRVAAAVGKVERVEVDAVVLEAEAGEKVPFASTEFAYLGKDTVGYHNRISMAWLGDVELLIVAACPSAEWLSGTPLIDSFLDETSIVHYSNP